MPRLLPCPSCARHVLAFERACPFCGVAQRVESSASVLTTALTTAVLGLTLVVGATACDSDKPPADKQDKQAKPDANQPADQILVPAEPDPPPIQPTTAVPVEPEPPVEPPLPSSETNAGTTDGSSLEPKPDAKPEAKPDPKLDEEPRPPKTYGGPPKPKLEPDFD